MSRPNVCLSADHQITYNSIYTLILTNVDHRLVADPRHTPFCIDAHTSHTHTCIIIFILLQW